jgi:hypothetical protein
LKFCLRKIAVWFGVACLLVSTVRTHAFALLGPFAPWMQATNGVIQPGDIGGPMDIGSGYRWNVPVVTYGFDKSFLDYFGTNGVAAIQSAIQIINDLPPASSLVLTNYPFNTQSFNYTAQVQGLSDLKSQTLTILLEQLGLTHPTRNIFVIKQWSSAFAPANYPSLYGISANSFLNYVIWPDWFIPDFIVMRNFDPQTFSASQYINGNLYDSLIEYGYYYYVYSYAADSFAYGNFAVADNNSSASLGAGGFFSGLTYDDVGGLCYLLSTNTVQYETLLPGISGIGANSNSFVNGAWRPGVDKITFVPQPVDSLSGSFLPTTNQFTDTCITNGNIIQQQVQRVITQPDFLFSVADTGRGDVNTPLLWRTGTTNWINNASANGNTNGEGPGVIQPPIQIVFNKLGLQCVSFGRFNEDENVGSAELPWGTFDDSTNTPITYPIPQTGTNQMTVRMWLERGNYPTLTATSFEWKPTSVIGSQFIFQTTTNMQTWVNLFTVTNDGTVCNYLNNNPASPSRFYRLMPQ